MAKQKTTSMDDAGQDQAPNMGADADVQTVAQGAGSGDPSAAAALDLGMADAGAGAGAGAGEVGAPDGGDLAAAMTDQGLQESDPLVECAVRMDCIFGRHDEIIELPASQAQAAEAGGFVDTHPNALAAIRGK